jgi:hypothetical protein
MPGLWSWGIDYQGQPLLDAWWTPGWTSQNRDGASVQVPPSTFSAFGFPSNLTYVNVSGNYFDTNADPISGYFTFWPSDTLIFTEGSQTTIMPQRYSGVNQTLLGINQMGDGKIFLQFGQLSVNLLATDNANMQPSTFTYHVKEYMIGGRQFDISVPLADSPTVDIHQLIIPGSIHSMDDDDYCDSHDRIKISSVSTQFIAADAMGVLPSGTTVNPSQYPVYFAFIPGSGIPASSTTWYTGSWASENVAQFMIGPGSSGLALAVGTYRVWLKVAATPQTPVGSVGYLEIF